jgi:hypothetical protein
MTIRVADDYAQAFQVPFSSTIKMLNDRLLRPLS